MTQRERHASAAVTEAGSRPSAGSPAAPGTPTAGRLAWEEYFAAAAPAVQQELLHLATQQGLLYSHQLPASNGSAHEPSRPLLSQLLAGKIDLPPLRPGPIAVEDAALDAVQREAVARALQTPDFCLIQGLPGTGKTRVLAEVITRAAARGERVLLLAATASALDHLLSLLHQREAIYAVRCLGRDENPDALSPLARSLTLAERVRRLREDARQAAQQALAAADAQQHRLAQLEPIWLRLEELADRHLQLSEQLRALADRLARVAAEVEEELRTEGAPRDAASVAAFDALRGRQRESVERLEKARAELAERLVEQEKEQTAIDQELKRLRPLAEAKERRRWWTLAWWRATGDRLARFAELEKRWQQTAEVIARLQKERQRLAAEREQVEQTFAAEQARLIESAVARRQAELSDREAALHQEERLIQEKWQAACHELGPEITPPVAPDRAAVGAAADRWRAQLRQVEERRSFARQWASYLEENAAALAARVRACINVAAATTTAAPEEQLGEDALPFDLLVLEEADRLTESEFRNLARRARRWVLAGEPPPEHPLPANEYPAARREAGKGKSSAAAPSGGLPPPLRQDLFFHRLWQQLHCDPRRLPYAWVHEKTGLCCRLRPVAPEQRQWLESERVADSPDIELRILAAPRTPPELVEVVFPASTSISEAKAYIFRELAELAVQAERHSLRWQEHPDRLLLALAPAPAADAVPVALGPGVRELVVARPAAANGDGPPGPSWHTCCLEFDRAAGWHRERAEEWVRQHLGVRDPGRTVRLDVPYRWHPDLAALLSEWLFDGAYELPPGEAEREELPAEGGGPSVQFVPVPALAPHHPPRRREALLGRSTAERGGATAVVPRLARAGAGLELDVDDARHRNRLPSELRDFAGHGFVNYLEAQAVVRMLERLAADPAVRAVARRWGADPARPVLGVLALYPAQAELIRRLLARVPALADGGVPIRVDVPAGFREGECWIGLVSLTRSHTHRAVSFGAGPELLVRALTRARARLVLFGDPGTLARRSQWEAPLDHLDGPASAREHRLVTRLVHYLNGHGAAAHRFQLCEGNGS